MADIYNYRYPDFRTASSLSVEGSDVSAGRYSVDSHSQSEPQTAIHSTAPLWSLQPLRESQDIADSPRVAEFGAG